MRQKVMLVLDGKLLPRISQRMQMRTRIGVRPEGIKCVVDGLFDVQPFPLESIQSTRGARFTCPNVSPIHPVP